MGTLLRQKQHLWANTAISCALTSFLIIFLSSTFHVERLEQGPGLQHAKQSVEYEVAFNSSNFFDSFELWKRAPLTWAGAQNKGRALACLMENTQAEAAIIAAGLFDVTTPYTMYTDLATWGWVPYPGYSTPEYGDSLDGIFSSIRINTANNVPVRLDQTQSVTVNGIFYPIFDNSLQQSGGRCANVYNARDGMIAADENYSPESMDPRKIGPNVGAPWVLLKQSSDLIFLEWQQQCSNAGVPVAGLKYVFRINVVNDVTLPIITQALSSSGSTIGDFAHLTTFYRGSAGYYALLGTPNASGVAIMLLQHKAQMGIKTIQSISIFNFQDIEAELTVPALFIVVEDYTPPS